MTKFREMYAKVISDKHEDVMAKFGATLAQGIIDAGNVTSTRDNHSTYPSCPQFTLTSEFFIFELSTLQFGDLDDVLVLFSRSEGF